MLSYSFVNSFFRRFLPWLTLTWGFLIDAEEKTGTGVNGTNLSPSSIEIEGRDLGRNGIIRYEKYHTIFARFSHSNPSKKAPLSQPETGR